MLDARDLEVTTQDESELIAINDFYLNFIRQKDELGNVILHADKYPNCIMLQIYAGIVHILSQSAKCIEAGKRFIERAQSLYDKANAREKLFLAAIDAGVKNNLIEAKDKYKKIIAQWPRDILAGLMVEFHCFELGCYNEQLETWEVVKDKVVDKKYPEEHHFWASYSYALELSGNPLRALEAANRALELQPQNPWAQHALAHAYTNLPGKDAVAIQLLEGHAQEWRQYGDFVRGHNYFHLALFYLRNNEFQKSFEIYQSQIKRASPAALYQQSDIIIFLWLFSLAEKAPHALKQAVKKECKWIYECRAVKDLMKQQQLFPFLSLSYVWLCTSVENSHKAKKILETLMNSMNESAEQSWVVGRKMAEGVLAFASNDYLNAMRLLEDIVNDSCIGGSDEQRSALSMTYDLACIKFAAQKTTAAVKALTEVGIFNSATPVSSSALPAVFENTTTAQLHLN